MKGGYAPLDARWTHAAVYLGDGQNICEATFTSILFGGRVAFNPQLNYCGSHAIRVRRSTLVVDKEMGWPPAIYATVGGEDVVDGFEVDGALLLVERSALGAAA